MELKSSFTGKVNDYDYLCKIARQLVQSGHLSIYKSKGRNVHQITATGRELFKWSLRRIFHLDLPRSKW